MTQDNLHEVLAAFGALAGGLGSECENGGLYPATLSAIAEALNLQSIRTSEVGGEDTEECEAALEEALEKSNYNYMTFMTADESDVCACLHFVVGCSPSAVDDLLRAARAAIAKAEGRQP